MLQNRARQAVEREKVGDNIVTRLAIDIGVNDFISGEQEVCHLSFVKFDVDFDVGQIGVQQSCHLGHIRLCHLSHRGNFKSAWQLVQLIVLSLRQLGWLVAEADVDQLLRVEAPVPVSGASYGSG